MNPSFIKIETNDYAVLRFWQDAAKERILNGQGKQWTVTVIEFTVSDAMGLSAKIELRSIVEIGQ